MLPQKIFKIRIFNLAENEFQTTKFPDFWNFVANSLTFQVNSDFSRFSRSVATLAGLFRALESVSSA